MKTTLLPVLIAVCVFFSCKHPQEDPSPNIESKQLKIVKVVVKDSLSGDIFTTKFIYDTQNRVIQTIAIHKNDSTITIHTYANNLLMSSISKNRNINYSYNADGLISQVIDKGQNYPDTINYEYHGKDLVKGKFKNGEFRLGNYVNGRPGYSAGFDSLIFVYDNNFNITQKYRPASGSYPKLVDTETTYGNIDISKTYELFQNIPASEFSQDADNPNKNTPLGKNLYINDIHYYTSTSIENTNEILSSIISNGYMIKTIVKSVNYIYNNSPDGSSTPEAPEYSIVNYYYE